MTASCRNKPVSVGVIDAGLGNVGSVVNMFHRTPAHRVEACAEPARASDFDLLVLPGVGAFDRGVERLEATGWYDLLKRQAQTGDTWIMGICLGMQLLCHGSDEGTRPGLGLIPGRFERLPHQRNGITLKVPHMGWNHVEPCNTSEVLASGLGPGNRFYFVHSYHYAPAEAPFVVGVADYGGPVVAALQNGNVFGVQFHPEKSHKFGLQLLGGIVSHIGVVKAGGDEGCE